MRVFLALSLPDELKQALGRVIDRLRALGAPIRWARPQGLHITLKYLGEIDSTLLESITTASDEACLHHPPLRLHVAGLGGFPNLRRPRVLWAGAQAPGITSLAHDIDAALTTFGFPSNEGELHPHITLGRVRGLEGWSRVDAEMKDLGMPHFGDIQVSRVDIFRSALGSNGSVYTLLHSSPLGAPWRALDNPGAHK